jgi:hypothetical protein
MDNRIRDVIITEKRGDPAEAEVHVLVYPERITPGTEVRGRLVGPSNIFGSTVEVAYPVREVSRSADQIVVRVIIPEPCLWEPRQPFLYQARVELWQDGVRCDEKQQSYALRKLRLSADELRINGRSTLLRGTRRVPQTDEEARALHDRGYSLIVADGTADSSSRSVAEKFGFLLLGRFLGAKGDIPNLTDHAGLVLWQVPGAITGEPPLPRYCRMGIELHLLPTTSLPYGDISLILCDEQALPELADIALPKLVLVDKLPTDNDKPARGVIGWVEH